MAFFDRTEDPLKNWPMGADGEPEEPVLLATEADFEAYGGLTVSRLEAFGVPVLTRRSQRGEVAQLFGGFSTSGVKIYVPKSRLAEANELLRPVEDAGDEEK